MEIIWTQLRTKMTPPQKDHVSPNGHKQINYFWTIKTLLFKLVFSLVKPVPNTNFEDMC